MRELTVSKTSKYCGVFTEGQEFGAWVVLSSKIFFDERSRSFVLCKCRSCNDPDYVPCYHLINRNTHLCGNCHLLPETRSGYSNNAWDGTKIPKEVKKHFKKHNIRISDYDAMQLLDKQKSVCYISRKYITIRNDPLEISSYNARLVKVDILGKEKLIWVDKKYESLFRDYSSDQILMITEAIHKLAQEKG